MYVCGPTVYDLPHLGHGRYTLVWDVARRWFTFRGLEVRFVSNITDIDDNIINRALRDSTTEPASPRSYEAEVVGGDGPARGGAPTEAPHATQYVPEMVELIGSFLASGVGYTTSDGIYFDVSRVKDYGLLAGQPLDSLRAGARVEANDEKRSPLDFALWKFAKSGEPSLARALRRWPARMAHRVRRDVPRAAGRGLRPAHGRIRPQVPPPRERAGPGRRGRSRLRPALVAQRLGDGRTEKMSKSLGNFTSLTDLVEKTDARAYRLLVLRSHYRSPIEVTPATIGDAERALARLDSVRAAFRPARTGGCHPRGGVGLRLGRRRPGPLDRVGRVPRQRPRHARAQWGCSSRR